MPTRRLLIVVSRALRLAALLAMAVASGCMYMPRAQTTADDVRNQALVEQSKAQLSEIAALRAHARKLEDQLLAAEQALAEAPTKSTASARR